MTLEKLKQKATASELALIEKVEALTRAEVAKKTMSPDDHLLFIFNKYAEVRRLRVPSDPYLILSELDRSVDGFFKLFPDLKKQ